MVCPRRSPRLKLPGRATQGPSRAPAGAAGSDAGSRPLSRSRLRRESAAPLTSVSKPTGTATEEVIVSQGDCDRQPHDRPLQRAFVRGGGPMPDLPNLGDSREHMRASLISIPWEGLKLSAGDPAIPVLLRGAS